MLLRTALLIEAMGLEKWAADLIQSMYPDHLVVAKEDFQSFFNDVPVKKGQSFKIRGYELPTSPSWPEGLEQPVPGGQRLQNIAIKANFVSDVQGTPSNQIVWLTHEELDNNFEVAPPAQVVGLDEGDVSGPYPVSDESDPGIEKGTSPDRPSLLGG